MRLSILGLVSVLAGVFAAPAFANNPASLSGSATFVTPAGFTSTVSAESVLPSGFFYNQTSGSTLVPAVPVTASAVLDNAAVIVVPAYGLLGFSIATTSLSVGSSAAVIAAPNGGGSFSAAAAQILTNSAGANVSTLTDGRGNAAGTYFSGNIEFIAAIIKAGAGVNGLD